MHKNILHLKGCPTTLKVGQHLIKPPSLMLPVKEVEERRVDELTLKQTCCKYNLQRQLRSKIR